MKVGVFVLDSSRIFGYKCTAYDHHKNGIRVTLELVESKDDSATYTVCLQGNDQEHEGLVVVSIDGTAAMHSEDCLPESVTKRILPFAKVVARNAKTSGKWMRRLHRWRD